MFLYVKILKKNARTINSGIFTSKIKKKMLKLLVLVFLQVKLKKNAKTISSGVLYVKMHWCYAN
jgi:hypothetical protein